MNHSIFATLLLLAAVTLLEGCKYPEGPLLSLQSREARIANTWEIAQAINKDGDNITAELDDLEFTFEEDGDASAKIPTGIGTFEFEGTWDLDNDETVFDLDLEDKATGLVPYDRLYDILRLTGDEFWLFDTQDSVEIRLETK